ncbi:MAG TPA: hypothetical protein H9815_07630 [Candidatus Ruania gallistercoris]|uniref:Uncharacterized protein n=1 Tax=Candidatus Ruania gallistercoris TaxID=2838746 RepID=A0A9D2J4R9_9MICO|nr:hypothetical protein [Candidatus Ruania gallistercoris]
MADEGQTREQRWEDRLAWPVLIAALASVPAVFLTLLGDPLSTWGVVASAVAGVVLMAEPVVLLAVSADKRAWLRRNWWLMLLAVLIMLSVVFALGPVQVFRLLRAIGALRVLRVGRIIKAGRILGRRHSTSPSRWPAVAASVLVAVFVGAVLADPTSTTRGLLADLLPEGWMVPIAVFAGLVLAGATFIVVRSRDSAEVGEDAADAG